MNPLSHFYQEVILDHNRKPRNYGRLTAPNRQADGHNPLCGDSIHLSLTVVDDRIQEIAFEGDGCAICKASASMMTGVVKGATPDQAETLISHFRAMTTGAVLAPEQESALGRLKAFEGVKDLPSRVKCAILPWHTLHAALDAVPAVSTEGDHDPVQAS